MIHKAIKRFNPNGCPLSNQNDNVPCVGQMVVIINVYMSLDFSCFFESRGMTTGPDKYIDHRHRGRCRGDSLLKKKAKIKASEVEIPLGGEEFVRE